MIQQKLLSLIFLILTLGIFTEVFAQRDWPNESHEKELKRAKVLIKAFRNDSAIVVLDNILSSVSRRNRNAYFTLQVQLSKAEALEKDNRDEEAIQLLLRLKDTTKSSGPWDIQAYVNLVLARMFEKINRRESCYGNLNDAKQVIALNNLDSIYPLFAVRYSSYQRFYGSRDSAVYFAKEAIKTAKQYSRLSEEGDGYLLMGILAGNDLKEKIKNFKSAAGIFKKLGDYNGTSAMYHNIAKNYFSAGNINEALAYNDSTILSGQRALVNGMEEGVMIFEAYKLKAKIFKYSGFADSAWHYINKGYEKHISYLSKLNNEKVVEIEARYQDEQKAQKIKEQATEINYERSRRSLLIGLITAALICIGVISYSWLRLKNARNKLQEQANIISENNEALSSALQKQMMLQSEVHHRVKNNLQVIISLLELQMDDIEDEMIHKTFKGMSNRIYSMAAIHEILYNQEDMSQVNFFDYVENLCTHFSYFSIDEKKTEFNIQIKDQYFNLETCMPLGLMLTELITNSLKYARVKGQKLMIDIELLETKDGYQFNYRDNGPGFEVDKTHSKGTGLGTYLLKSMSRQLNGNLEIKNRKGACYNIYFKEKNKIN